MSATEKVYSVGSVRKGVWLWAVWHSMEEAYPRLGPAFRAAPFASGEADSPGKAEQSALLVAPDGECLRAMVASTWPQQKREGRRVRLHAMSLAARIEQSKPLLDACARPETTAAHERDFMILHNRLYPASPIRHEWGLVAYAVAFVRGEVSPSDEELEAYLYASGREAVRSALSHVKSVAR